MLIFVAAFFLTLFVKKSETVFEFCTDRVEQKSTIICNLIVNVEIKSVAFSASGTVFDAFLIGKQ